MTALNVQTMNQSADVTLRLNNLKAQIDEGKTQKAKAQANLETYTKQRDEIVAQLAELGVTPDNLEAEILKLDGEIEEGLTRAEELLRG